MSDGTLAVSGYSTLDVRLRAVRAVVVNGFTVTDVAFAYGTTRSTIHRWLARFHEEGDHGLNRRAVPGRPRKLMEVDAAGLKEIVLSPASEHGFETDFWTTRRLIQVVRSEYGVLISKQTMMRRLHEAGLTYQKPERQYFELSEEERQEWRRKELPKIRRAVRKYRGILYFQDEANISLTALLGKTWAPRGKTPKQKVTGNRGGVSAMSAIVWNSANLMKESTMSVTTDTKMHRVSRAELERRWAAVRDHLKAKGLQALIVQGYEEKIGGNVRLKTDSRSGKEYQGRITFIASEAEFTPKQIQTQEERVKLVYRIKVEVANPQRELKSNMPVDGEILL